MNTDKTIVTVLRSGGDFSFSDVELIFNKINKTWKSKPYPRLICFYDKVDKVYDLNTFELHPLPVLYPGTWSRLYLYSDFVKDLRPFLYVDLDTAIIESMEIYFDLIKNKNQYVCLEDFWQKGKMATGLVWFPYDSEQVKHVWEARENAGVGSFRMDNYLRKMVTPDAFWQQLTNTIYDFKPQTLYYLKEIPDGAHLICFHGKPRIPEAAKVIEWVKNYIQ